MFYVWIAISLTAFEIVHHTGPHWNFHARGSWRK